MIFKKLAQMYFCFIVLFLILGSIKAFQIYDVLNSDFIFQKPNSNFWMGTDSLGRDLWSRLIVGGVVSLVITFIASLGALVVGVLCGAVAGWSENSIDRWFLRLINVYQTIPSFVVASVLFLSFQNIFQNLKPIVSSTLSLKLCLIFTHWVSSARLIRAEIKRMKSENFVLASVSLGASQMQILKAHLWLYLRHKLRLLLGFIFPSVLFYESFLSFVGFGIQAPLTSWGLLIQEGWRNMGSYPHLIFIPMFFVVTFVWSINVIMEKSS